MSGSHKWQPRHCRTPWLIACCTPAGPCSGYGKLLAALLKLATTDASVPVRQACGLVPIVEPEVLIDGGHSIARSGAVAERVLQACVAALWQRPVTLEAALLKPMMVLPGADHAGPPTAPGEVAQATLTAMRRCFAP